MTPLMIKIFQVLPRRAFCVTLSPFLFCVLSLAQEPAATVEAPAQSQQTGQPAVQPAQPAQPGDDPGSFTIRTSVNEVNLIFTVTDKRGRFIKDLRQSDFALLDDQKAPAHVFSFAQETNLPLRVGILVDASTSIRQRFQFEQQATSEFLMQLMRPKTDKAFVMGFDATPDLKQDWTNNLDLLETGINALRPGGGTALFDALYTACHDKLLDSTRGLEPVRKAIVLVSDGDDNQSRAFLDDSIKMCQRAETIVYTISTNTSPSRGRGDEILKKISDATGGITFYPQRIEDISNGFRNIADELRSQYDLVYRPADFKSDGAFRTIYLFCLDRKYTVRTRRGYFAPRD
jgi:VWFA-related protein